jgi:DNA-binding PadR family transcriptional regulator
VLFGESSGRERWYGVAKRRKVGNILALAILSALAFEPMHPYQMATVLRERGKDRDMAIKWGTLYTVVANLEKHGFITATESARSGGRPERTVYAITDAGRAEMTDWLRELLRNPEREPLPFTSALSVMAVLGPDEVIPLLRQRTDTLAARIAEQRAALAGLPLPRLFVIEAEYELAVSAAELAWTRALIGDLTGGTMPDVDWWRTLHETGRVPPELVELLERKPPD